MTTTRRRRRVRPRTLTALLLLAVTGQPVDALPPLDRALTIVGSRTSYVTITVREETRYYLDRATAQYAGGRWGGFLIGPDSSRPGDGRRDTLTLWTAYDEPGAGASQARATFRGHPARFAPYESMTGVLAPGRYRVYLFTDGQEVTVTLPWTAPSRVLEPERALPARIEAEQAVVSGDGTPAMLAMPLDASTRSVTEAAAVFVDGGDAAPDLAGRNWACFASVTSPKVDKSCHYGPRSTGSSAGGRRLGGRRVERMYGSAKGLQWRASAPGSRTAVLAGITVRFDP